MLVAERIREKAAARKLGLNELADAADVSRPHLYAVLAGKRSPTIEWLTKVSTALGCEVYELLRPSRGRQGR